MAVFHTIEQILTLILICATFILPVVATTLLAVGAAFHISKFLNPRTAPGLGMKSAICTMATGPITLMAHIGILGSKLQESGGEPDEAAIYKICGETFLAFLILIGAVVTVVMLIGVVVKTMKGCMAKTESNGEKGTDLEACISL